METALAEHLAAQGHGAPLLPAQSARETLTLLLQNQGHVCEGARAESFAGLTGKLLRICRETDAQGSGPNDADSGREPKEVKAVREEREDGEEAELAKLQARCMALEEVVLEQATKLHQMKAVMSDLAVANDAPS